MARKSSYLCADNLQAGDETRYGIVAGVIKNDPMVTLQFHNRTETLHKFAPVEVYESGS
jgi:hypothetical protein